MNLNKLRQEFEKQITTRDYILSEISDLQSKLNKSRKQLLKKEKALLFIEDVAIQTQMELSDGLQDCIAAGLNSVFDEPYGFRAEFKINRGKPECTMAFLKSGKLADPLGFSGGGEVDVAAFSARVACLSMAPQFPKILIIDEPFLRLKGIEQNKRVLALMKDLSHKLGLQIICVNDERAAREDIIENADRVFYVYKKGGKSQVKVLEAA